MLWLGNIKGSLISIRLQNRKVQEISENLLFLRSSLTSDFSRFPRGLNEIPRWKATEFRLFLLYTGPIVLKYLLNNECYLNFMCLHICFRILLFKNSNDELVNFVENFCHISFKNLVSYMNRNLYFTMYMGFFILLMTIKSLAL